METTIIGYILGFILGLYWDNGKENGNYYIIIGYRSGQYNQEADGQTHAQALAGKRSAHLC